MKMICVNNIYHETELTIGKIYDFQKMTDGDDSAYLITNDLGEPWVFTSIADRSRFQTLEYWREKQLNKIL